MSGMIKKTVLILKGKEQMADWGRVQFLAVFLEAVHFILAGIGLGIGCWPLAAISLAALAIEIAALYFSKKFNNTFVGISILYFTVCIHSLVACVVLGWTFGFSLYNLAAIPVLFYMLYFSEDAHQPKKCALAYTAVNCIVTLVLRRYVYLGEPHYAYNREVSFWVSFFNNLSCFLFVIIFSTMFMLELMANREKLENQAEELKCLADYDSLTKLRNRRSMLHVWESVQRDDYCVVMGDIDDFKKVNDTYGHEAGDEVLKLVASIMQNALDSGDYASRWGGEEFLMLVFGSASYALKVIGRVQRELKNAELSVRGKRIAVTMTFGVSECGEAPDGNLDELLRRADRRLYIGKNSGKNCIIMKDE